MNRSLTTRLGFETYESRDVASVSPVRPVGNLLSLADASRPAVVASAETPSPTPTLTGAGRITGVVADPADYSAIAFVGGWGSSM
jgi:hypothetical protein